MSSTLDLDNESPQPDRQLGIGHGTDALGPSDRSDTGSDMMGITGYDSDTDSVGTGERAGVEPNDRDLAGLDIDIDRIDRVTDAGLDPLDDADEILLDAEDIALLTPEEEAIFAEMPTTDGEPEPTEE